MDVSKHRPKAVLDYTTVLRSVFFKIVHFVPAKREFNRLAKYRQVKDGTPVHVELAVKYWSRRSDFSHFTAIPIASFSTYQEAWIFEHLLISRWQPPLNHPFITN